ncbi:uncharacterized protein At5g39570 isoform X1 [Selaginella moellendorffii]|nr:uncharacterized protein At5g39570 isoform X1 [Selaginella moellendorffii]XP_024545817.1 uncharacterized protein At5g39570 isoform X1 [Selaginella moellendorffii]|eukprot:XP_024545816.1 uncharacterized protein At5g39570 isoform X1 [Selaginella moellendorffii]
MARGWGRDRGESAEDHDDYDPEPFVGGYDIGSWYGPIKEASPDWSYPPYPQSGEEEEETYVDTERVADYGSAKPSHYGHGQGTSSSYGTGKQEYSSGHGQQAGYGDGSEESAEYGSSKPSYGYGSGGIEQTGYG